MSTFKERIAELFELAKDTDPKLTQIEFAQKCGASRSQFTGWLSGQGSPNPDMLRRIAITWNVSVDWLVGNSNVRTPLTTMALHRSDDPMTDLPPEAIRSIEEFKELMRLKYKIKKPTE